MLCKAAVMQDYATYDKIAAARDPRTAKRLGRAVSPFSAERWDAVVCEVALEAVAQKFEHVPGLAAVLLGTGDALVAEMARSDANWGTGLKVGHADASRPHKWPGTNILGWALMEARSRLRAAAVACPDGRVGKRARESVTLD